MSGQSPKGVGIGVVVAGLIAAACYLVGVTWAANTADYNLWGALVVLPVLVALTVPLARRVARIENDPRMARLILVALMAKLTGAFVRYYLILDLYGGHADAAAYAGHGARLAESYRQGIFFGLEVGRSIPGTGFLRVLTGLVFTVTGPTRLGGFLVFSWFGFWGLYFFYRAFRVGVPNGDHRRYALLVFFLPSLLFWPSSIGKESWMLLGLGLSAYGAARILSARQGGYLVLGLGLLATGMVRPHMSALVCAGLMIGYLLRRTPNRSINLGPLTRLVGLAVLVVATSLVLTQVEEFFGTEEEGVGAAEEVFDRTADMTAQGGSEFTPASVRSPAHLPRLPIAVLTVLFRPLPFDAHNTAALFASAESALLLGLFALWWRRLVRLPSEMLRTPYVMFAVVYTLAFVVAFSNVGNFGILARQRVQVLPVLVAAVAAATPPTQPGMRVRNYEVLRRAPHGR